MRIKSLTPSLKEDKSGERLLDAQRILELAQRAHSLYVTRRPAEQAEFLKEVLLNCFIDAVTLYPTYRKPFDLIAKRANLKNGRGGGIRTPDPLLPKQMRYQAALRPDVLSDCIADRFNL